VAGVGVVQVLQDGQGLPPGIMRLWLLAGGEVAVAEMGEYLGFVEAVAKFPEDAQGVLVTGDGLRRVAKFLLGVAEAVPGVRFADAIA
jgi:hypothetical protein